jgi:hypothetical protein
VRQPEPVERYGFGYVEPGARVAGGAESIADFIGLGFTHMLTGWTICCSSPEW